MNSFKFWLKISRPLQAVIGGCAAWITALLSDGSSWVNIEKIAAGIVITLSIMSASIFHYGARYDIYAKKRRNPVFVRHPDFLIFCGSVGFGASFVLAGIYLGAPCLLLAVFNAAAIGLYPNKLDRRWPWKNLTIATLCITPLLMGWLASHQLNSIVLFAIACAFCIYLAREILKDIVDRAADCGKRLTMVMTIGITASLRVAGIILLIAAIFVFCILQQAPEQLIIKIALGISGGYLAMFAIILLVGKNISRKYAWIDVGVITMLICFLLIRINT